MRCPDCLGWSECWGFRAAERPTSGPACERTEAWTTVGNLSFWGTHPPDVVRLATVNEVSYTTRRGTIRGGDLATKKAER